MTQQIEAAPSGAVSLPCGCDRDYVRHHHRHTGPCRWTEFDARIWRPDNADHPSGAVLVAPYTLWIRDDGGRADAGFRGSAGDCAARAVAIATGAKYVDVYDRINVLARTERTGKRKRGISNARLGVYRPLMHRLMAEHGATWTPLVGIGTGSTTRLRADELPDGRLVLSLSKHYAAVLGGVVHDTHDPTRNGTRCVYGYWRLS